MNSTNGTSNHHVNGSSKAGTETCPLCKSSISRKEFERITRISEAREKQFAEEHAMLAREIEEISRRRGEIAEEAAAEESSKWEAEAQRVAREIATLQDQTVAEQQRVAKAHKKEIADVSRALEKMQVDVAKSDAKAKAALEKAQAKAETDAVALARAAKREAEEEMKKLVSDLRASVKAVEQRRLRDEDHFKRTIAELARKAESKDRAHFGPESELEVVEVLRREYPQDEIQHHGRNGDILHLVRDGARSCGSILYEIKSTAKFQRAFIRQTAAAREKRGALHGILVSRVLPARAMGICAVGGILVVSPPLVASVVSIIRDSMIAIARMHVSEEDKAIKGAQLVEFLRSHEFVDAMKRINIRMSECEDALAAESRAHESWWRSRSANYSSVIRATCGVESRINELLHNEPANDNAITEKKITEKKEKVR